MSRLVIPLFFDVIVSENITGSGGYLSDPGINDSDEQFKSANGSNSKPFHFIPTKSVSSLTFPLPFKS